MTLRDCLGGDVPRIHAQVDALLNSEDALLALFDGGRSSAPFAAWSADSRHTAHR
jgi:hypothetical protein